ncbi:Zinc ABC transporter inner membrane permease protein ZnuB [Lactococcus lactis subsp. lactis]|uniref:metal ABC transporter permease n=1 Tax=Lactococcus lactis TaxID=1358 RepID=UPI0005147571|nr:metal ABC transporter permease [Lactococcus lactis]KGF76228.1 hypothetical protein Llab_1784 [Lactococcus lactis]KST89935.1 Zinc ABC transporter inner membrane permease protein ZnuB [Lactococcus lactis subsp. lactis]
MAIFTQSFMVNAWISGTMIALLSSFIGFFIILRSSTFSAHVIPEIGFSGGAGAVFFSINPLWGLAIFSIGGAFMIKWLTNREKNDTASGLTLITLLGVGALFLSLSNQYASGAYALLFGQILGVSDTQTYITIIFCFLCIALLFICYRPILLTSISLDLAKSRGVKVALIDSLFLLTIALAATVIVPIVGTLLCFSLLIVPNAASVYLASEPKKVITLSLIISLISIWFAIILGYITGWPIGFFVSIISTTFYLLSRCLHFIKD